MNVSTRNFITNRSSKIREVVRVSVGLSQIEFLSRINTVVRPCRLLSAAVSQNKQEMRNIIILRQLSFSNVKSI